MRFALISEGPSEHRIIKHIVAKFFKDEDPEINPIQPRLINGKQDQTTPGGWNEVLKYCEGDELQDIMVENDYLVIQIDTDQSQTAPFNISHSNTDNTQKIGIDLYSDVIEKMKSLIKQEIKDTYPDQIIFAICIHTIECWLIPIYYTNIHKTKTLNCLSTLNDALRKKDIHIITPENKNEPNGIKAYDAVLKNWKKKQDISKSAQHNIGFKKFIESLGTIEAFKS